MDQITLHTGYHPGLIGTISARFSQHFHALCGLGAGFEAKVATEMSDFIARLPDPALQVWHARRNEHVVGSLFIDGRNLGQNRAHLRWFILTPQARGQGTGQALMDAAMAHVDAQDFAETQLWTIKGTDAARTLYERHGFHLASEFTGDQWGAPVTEQHFIRLRK